MPEDRRKSEAPLSEERRQSQTSVSEDKRKSQRRESQRRSSTRFKIEQMIELSFGKESFVQAAGLNISEGGFLCQSDENIDLHARLFIMIGLLIDDEDQKIKCEGIVTRLIKESDHYKLGVSFTEMQNEEREKLKNFLLTGLSDIASNYLHSGS